jgi:hypothetical protein
MGEGYGKNLNRRARRTGRILPRVVPWSYSCLSGTVGVFENESVEVIQELFLMKIEKQADWEVKEFEVTQKLSLVDRENFFDCFYFDEETVVDQQIKTQRVLPDMMFVSNIHRLLAGDLKATIRKFTVETPFVNGFQQSRTFIPMHLQRGSDHLPTQPVSLFK